MVVAVTLAQDMERWARENQITAVLGAVALSATVFWLYTRRTKVPGGTAVHGDAALSYPNAMSAPAMSVPSSFRTGIQSTSIPYDARNYYTDFQGLRVPGDWG